MEMHTVEGVDTRLSGVGNIVVDCVCLELRRGLPVSMIDGPLINSPSVPLTLDVETGA